MLERLSCKLRPTEVAFASTVPLPLLEQLCLEDRKGRFRVREIHIYLLFYYLLFLFFMNLAIDTESHWPSFSKIVVSYRVICFLYYFAYILWELSLGCATTSGILQVSLFNTFKWTICVLSSAVLMYVNFMNAAEDSAH